MASNKLIGSALDQISTNGDLGGMAFQMPEAVDFTGGRGTLSKLDITAISQQLNVSAADVFVYDTRKDSDAGAWRKRCGHTTWYNETLNTTIRGSRKEFPSVAVIVSYSGGITIYDGDSPDLPMWMVFYTGGVWNSGLSTLYALGRNISGAGALYALQAKLCVTCTTGYAEGLIIIDFLSETVQNASETSYKHTWLGNALSLRNTQCPISFASASSAPSIVNLDVNNVAITVLPNAPIDAATGLPVPTIAAATSGGVSVIKSDGTVVSSAYNSNYSGATVSFKGSTLYTTDASGGPYPILWVDNIDSLSASWTWSYISYTVLTDASGRSAIPISGNTIAHGVSGTSTMNPSRSLKLIDRAASNSNNLYSFIGTKYNTGWMPGDIKGAWLSDTAQETVVGAELTTNGDMSSSTGWSTNAAGGGGSFTFNGQLTITQGASSVWMFAGQSFATVPGKSYTVSFQIITASAAPNWNMAIGTVFQSSNIAQYGYYYGNYLTAGTHTFQFTAVSTTTWFTIMQGGGANVAGVIDNVSIRAGDADCSVNNKGLQVYGSITKTPVATGADLVAYSGFSTSNYLEQPYNSNLNFGTGEFSFVLWVRSSNFAAASQFITGIDQAAGTLPKLMVYTFSDGRISLHTNGFESAIHAVTATTPAPNVWHQIVCGRKSGVFYMYLDGALSGSATATITISFASAAVPLAVGYRTTEPGVLPFNGDISLLRISSTFPSDEQIKKMYNDEKVLLQDNAKATLYGTSDAVTAVAYDDDTQLLHVGTSSGRSVFQGLRRVDNTTTAVSAAISASNGLVAEQ